MRMKRMLKLSGLAKNIFTDAFVNDPEAIGRQLENRVDEFPFLSYAALCWVTHAKCLPDIAEFVLISLLGSFVNIPCFLANGFWLI